MTIPFQPIVINPSLKDVLDQLKKDVLLSINCHAIATVESVSAATQTLVATVNYSKTYYKQDESGQFAAFNVDYPILLDVPFIVLGGGQCSLTFPITKGDQCLIFFNDRDMDNWFAGATSGPVATGRLHSLADGIALVGLKMNVASYDSTRAVLQNGTTMVGVSSTKVKISNGTTLNTLLQQLISDIKTITTTNAVVGAPCALNPASIAALTADATAIGALLE